MKYWCLFLTGLLSLLFLPNLSTFCSMEYNVQFDNMDQEKLAEVFNGYNASFVLLDSKSGRYLRYNPELCAKRLSPCSTFKILNSLVGLETGVIKDENHSMKWDGNEYAIESWNRDQTLQSAVSNSVVWYFQRLASEVGGTRMEKYLRETHYGNEDISAGINKFWLGSSLKISAEEQVEFLKKLVNDELPFSKRSMAIVRGLIRLDQTEKGTLYGKTGSNSIDSKKVLGWFVGYIVQPDRNYIFAANIQATDNAWGPQAKELVKKMFNSAGLL
jgi:bla regulator protein BlaR1